MDNTILITDDNPENLKVLSGILEPEGYTVRVALTGETKLDASGRSGGGTIEIGGGYQGSGDRRLAWLSYVGTEVQMRFRLKFLDKRRGMRHYFWKAVPVAGSE